MWHDVVGVSPSFRLSHPRRLWGEVDEDLKTLTRPVLAAPQGIGWLLLIGPLAAALAHLALRPCAA